MKGSGWSPSSTFQLARRCESPEPLSEVASIKICRISGKRDTYPLIRAIRGTSLAPALLIAKICTKTPPAIVGMPVNYYRRKTGMNEEIRLQLLVNREEYPVGNLYKDGLSFPQETDPARHRFTIGVLPGNDITAYRLQRIRQLQDWRRGEYHLNLTIKNRQLVLTGVRPDGLPGGQYDVSLMIEDLPVLRGRMPVTLPENGSVTLPVHVHPDQRQIVLDDTAIDEAVAALLDASTVDGENLLAWLADARWRASRKACLLNLVAKLRSLPHNDPHPLIKEIVEIFKVGTERVYARVTPGFYETLQALARNPKHPFYYEGRPTAPIHQLLLGAAKVSKTTHTLESFRQEGKTCMQAVIAVPKEPHGPYFADLDIDLGNPLQDVIGFITHIAELGGGPTDHLDLRTKLDHDDFARPYLYYRVDPMTGKSHDSQA
jgi:hypothetical protein